MVRNLLMAVVLVPVLWLLWAGSGGRPALPALDALTPVEAELSAWRERRSPSRDRYRYIEFRLEGVDTTFVVNDVDVLGDESGDYGSVRAALRPGVRFTVWARVRAPRPVEMMRDDYDPARYADHRIPSPANYNPFGIGNMVPPGDVGPARLMPFYEALQIAEGGELVLAYERVAAAHDRLARIFHWLWIACLVLAAFVYGRLLLVGVAITHGVRAERRERAAR